MMMMILNECTYSIIPTVLNKLYRRVIKIAAFHQCELYLLIIWLANFAIFHWPTPGPIIYGTDPDGPVTFAFFRFCFICTLFKLVVFTNEMAIHFGFDKRSLGLEIRLFYDWKKKQKSRNNYSTPKSDYENCQQQQILNLSLFLFCFKNTRAIEQAVLYKSFRLDNRQQLNLSPILHQLLKQ